MQDCESGEGRKMCQEDKNDMCVRALEAATTRAAARADDVDVPRFRPGQSVWQWWASWFTKATEPPKTYNRKNRPCWFRGEVLSPGERAPLGFKYAGVPYSGYVYHTY